MTVVAVTGASGFIAQHIIKLLLEKGYTVVGTVRSEKKGAELKERIGSTHFSYVVVDDLGKEGSIDKLLSDNDIDYFLHTAMPFFYDTEHPKEDLVDPAVNGITSILASIERSPKKIKKFVLTSSDAAVYTADDEQNSSLSFNENSWNDSTAVDNPIVAYYTAKALSEKYVWKFLKDKGEVFEFVSVNPVYVFGPQAYPLDRPLNTSNTVILGMLNGEDFDNDKGGFVDVRDVAKAHIFAIESPNAIGKRLLMSNGHFSNQMIADIINAKYPGKAAKGTPGSGPKDITTLAKVDNSATKKLLGFDFISLKKSVEDTVEQALNKS